MCRISIEHHFIRYCKPSQSQDGKILSAAFRLRLKNPNRGRTEDEKTLSVDWFEFFTKNHYSNINSALIERKMETNPNGYLAKLNVGKSINDIIKNSHCSSGQLYVEIIKNSYSHFFGLYGFDEDTNLLIENSLRENIMEIKKIGKIKIC
ncbi:MAG: hypothetical protein A2014_07850 [Spirochaetes bacterium GWF1_49_6]|nr:MAG: hypothetical protein A2014_07850 [Spirochaetes bacterium GWF1_49_6]